MTTAGEERFASIYRAHHRQVLAYCRRRANIDDVDDLAAEVFLTVWRKIDQAPTDDGTLPWLYRVAYLVFSNHWRSAGRRKKLEQKMQSIGMTSPEPISDQIVVRHELNEVLEAAKRLRPKDQEILKLSMWENLSTAEIAAVVGVEPNTAKQRLHRARKALIREHERISRKSQPSPAAQKGGEW